jgi:hypothetical protein
MTRSKILTFSKRIDISGGILAFLIEREKVRRMSSVFEQELDLETPRLLNDDESTGILELEHLPPMQSFSPSTDAIWFALAGRALALTHSRLRLEGEYALTRRVDRGRDGLVFLHGDYMPNNMGIAVGRLVVFDWGLRPWSNEIYTQGTPSLDLASFLGPWMCPKWWDPRLPVRKLRVMVDAYIEAIGPRTSIASLARETLEEEVAAQFRHRLEKTQDLPILKRVFHAAKLRWNFWILQRALAPYGYSEPAV